MQYISQYDFAVEAPTLQQAVLPSKHAGNPHAYLRELNHVSAWAVYCIGHWLTSRASWTAAAAAAVGAA